MLKMTVNILQNNIKYMNFHFCFTVCSEIKFSNSTSLIHLVSVMEDEAVKMSQDFL